MTANYSVLGQSAPTGTTETTLLTVATGKQVVTSTLSCCNLTTGFVKATVNVKPAGAATGNAHRLLYQTVVKPNQSLILTLGLTLGPTDVVSVQSDTANGLAFHLYGTVMP
jgi:hypothetical protein